MVSGRKGFIVYGLVDPRHINDIRYIGKSTRGLERPLLHRNALLLSKEKTYKANWIRGLIAAGVLYEVVVLEEVAAPELLVEAERRWIAHGRSQGWRLTNLTEGGDGTTGWKATAETRARMSAAQRGRKVSDEQRQRLKNLRLGTKLSEEHKAKISLGQQGRIGRPISQEQRARHSVTMTGRTHTAATRAKLAMTTRDSWRRSRILPRVRLNLLRVL